MITIENLTVSYNSKIILKDLNLSMEEGGIHGLVGLNGTGKTTFLNTLYGLKKKDSGIILFQNQPLLRKKIGYLESENFFYKKITGQEYLDLFCNKNFDNIKWNNLFNLPLNQFIESYSTGMKKKLALMALFKQNKEIIILDEPFNGLDIDFTQTLILLLKKMKSSNKTIVITSHIINTLISLCDFVHILKNQRILTSVTQNDFFSLEDMMFKEFNKEKQSFIDQIYNTL